LAFSPAGDTLATGSADKSVKLWNTSKMTETAVLRSKTHAISAICFSPDNDLLLQCTTDNKLAMYRIKNNMKQILTFMAHTDLITGARFSYSKKLAITSSMDNTLKFWDFNSGDIKNVVNTYSKVYDMHLSRSEATLVSGHEDKSIRLWNAKTRESIYKFDEAHSDVVCCVRFTPDENYLVSASIDNTLKIWDIRQ